MLLNGFKAVSSRGRTRCLARMAILSGVALVDSLQTQPGYDIRGQHGFEAELAALDLAEPVCCSAGTAVLCDGLHSSKRCSLVGINLPEPIPGLRLVVPQHLGDRGVTGKSVPRFQFRPGARQRGDYVGLPRCVGPQPIATAVGLVLSCVRRRSHSAGDGADCSIRRRCP